MDKTFNGLKSTMPNKTNSMLRYSLASLLMLNSVNAHSNVEFVGSEKNIYADPITVEKNESILEEDVLSKKQVIEIKKRLLRKYKGIDEIALNLDQLTQKELTVASIMVLEQQRNHRKLQKKAQLELDKSTIDDSFDGMFNIHEATMSDANILKRKSIDERIKKTSRKNLHPNKTSIRPIVIDPESNDVITINFAINRPSSVTFFDEQGHPYPVTDIAPTSNAYFDNQTMAENIVMFTAKEEYRQANGFVFLQGVSQPIPVVYSLDPTKPVDTKLIVTVLGISPTNKAEFETIGVDITPFSNQTSETSFRILNGMSPANSKRLTILGDLPAGSKAWEVVEPNGDTYHWVRTKAAKRYEYIKANRLGKYFAYKLQPRTKHWFLVDGKRVAVQFHIDKRGQ
ncbi:DotH/IcmK family type IV secretion protein [Photobacterium leiognathi]|uniref:DotH/IcmK family type IV secretion protein n=1 Tax=Photobacterium leiognathi TaxID=553611 RepID=UPI0029822C82|nr:DotH/IcmK family type IV secretion protein [Photobacterium leiognathi]